MHLHQVDNFGKSFCDMDSRPAEFLNLSFGGSSISLHNGPSISESNAWHLVRKLTRHEGNDREIGAMFKDIFRQTFLGRPSGLTENDNSEGYVFLTSKAGPPAIPTFTV